MPSIDTLVDDIGKVLSSDGLSGSLQHLETFTEGMSDIYRRRVVEEQRVNNVVRMSNLGANCERKLWYTVNVPEEGEKFSPSVSLKFMFGDVVENIILSLAKEAGHEIIDQQMELRIDTPLGPVVGHIDAIIDGCLVDVKSASTYSYNKFMNGTLEENDPFNYIEQTSTYLYALSEMNHPALVDRDNVYFLVVDKTLGHFGLARYPARKRDYRRFATDRLAMTKSHTPPARGFADVEAGKSGNRKLGTECSYCNFKKVCWPNIRAFAYAGKVEFLTNVANEPKVPEVDLNGEGAGTD
jgi:hypothetical protein